MQAKCNVNILKNVVFIGSFVLARSCTPDQSSTKQKQSGYRKTKSNEGSYRHQSNEHLRWKRQAPRLKRQTDANQLTFDYS